MAGSLGASISLNNSGFVIGPLARPVFLTLFILLGFLDVLNYRRGMVYWMDSLSTYTHHSDLQATTTSFLISTLYITQRYVFSVCLHQSLLSNSSRQWIFLCSVFTRRFLVNNFTKGDSSTSVVTPLHALLHSTPEISTDNCQAGGLFTPAFYILYTGWLSTDSWQLKSLTREPATSRQFT
jgi:hypothetical protein